MLVLPGVTVESLVADAGAALVTVSFVAVPLPDAAENKQEGSHKRRI